MIETLEIDGVPATVETLIPVLVSNYGAFTSMQVEPGGVRGLELHLARLHRAAVELFGQPVATETVRERIRSALAGREGRFSVRVHLFLPSISLRRADARGRPSVLVRVSAPQAPLPGPLKLQSQIYRRELPHLKHAGTFGLTRAIREAKAANFDDALFVDSDGLISEGSIWNIGFIEGQRVVWPDAPMLAGVGQALLQRGLDAVGFDSERRAVRLSEMSTFDGAFVCNSTSPATAVEIIDQIMIRTDPSTIERLHNAWASNPVEPI